MEILKGIGFFIAIVVFHRLIFKRKDLEDEFSRNESHDPPAEHQLKWHIRHIREDIQALTVLGGFIFYALLFIIVFGIPN